MGDERINVIVPVYNVEPYLNKCISSILNQNYPNLRLVLVDDGSSDSSSVICDDYTKFDSRVFVIHKTNMGPSSSRNTALDYILILQDSKWVTFIDGDDWVSEDYLSTLYNIISSSNSQVGIGKIVHLPVEETECCFNSEGTSGVLSPEMAYCDKNINTISACSKLFDLSLFKSLKFPEGRVHEDRATIYLALFRAKSISYTNNEIYAYMYNPNSISHVKINRKYIVDNLVAVEEQLQFFNDHKFNDAWNSAAVQYLDLIVGSLNKISCEKSMDDIRNRYVSILHRFIFRNFIRIKCKMTKKIFCLFYPYINI